MEVNLAPHFIQKILIMKERKNSSALIIEKMSLSNKMMNMSEH
jgi:hypothetical protein